MVQSSELKIALDCLRSFVSGRPTLAPRRFRSPVCANLSRLAEEEGIAGILSGYVQDLQPFESTFADDLRSQARATFFRGGALWAELERLRLELEAAAIPAILLKGAALLATVYEQRLSLRPLSDIDLLIRPQHLDTVKEMLRQHGLMADGRGSLLFLNRQLAVDLHLELTGTLRIRSRGQAYQIDGSALWDASCPWPEPHSTSPGGFRLLAPEHQFLHLSVHALKHSYSRLIWMVDLALVWKQLDSGQLLEQAEAFGMRRPLRYSLHLLQGLLHLDDLESLMARLPPLHGLEELFLDRVARRRTDSLGGLVQACSIPDWKQRLCYLSEAAFPRPQIMAGMFPGTSPWLAYPWRATRLLARGLREMGRVMFG